MKSFHEKICPRCHHEKMKAWTDLNGEEKFLAERLPLSAEFTKRERETHLFCPRCWLEIVDDSPQTV